MPDNEKITTKLEVDVTDFKKGLSDANRYIRMANSEFENATAGIGKFVDSADGLRAKLNQLDKVYAGQEAALRVLRAEHERVAAEQGANSKAAQELEIKINKQEAACKKTASQIDHYQASLDDMERSADEAGGESEKLGDSLADVADSAKKADKATDGVGDGLASSFNKAASAAGNLVKKMAGIAGKAVMTGIKGIAGALTATVGSLTAAAESTREYRTAMGKLETAFTQAGHSSEDAVFTYKELQAVLGDTDQAVEASNHLAKLCDNEEDLCTWGDIATGVYATFGDSLPIEGLAEAANETAKTGSLTGGLADALNWAGVNEEKFQEQLDACNTEQERAALITETMNGLYSEAAEKYRETNAEVIRANQANEKWTSSMADLGAAFEPILSDVKLMGASLLEDLLPGVEKISEAFRGLLGGDAGAAEALGEAITGIVRNLLNKITSILPTVANVGVSLLSSLSTSVVSMLPQLVTVGVQIISSILSGLSSALPQITEALVGMVPVLTGVLVNSIPQLIDGATQLLLAIVSAIDQIIPPLIAALPRILTALVQGLMSAAPQLLQGATQLLLAIVEAVPLLIQQLVPQIPTIVTTIIQGLTSSIGVLLQGATQLLMAIVDAIPLLIEALIPEIPNIIDTIVTELTNSVPILLDAAVQLLLAIVQAIPQIVSALVQNMPQILQAILSVMATLPRLLWNILQEVLTYVGKWLGSMGTKAGETGKKFLDNVVKFMKELPGKISTWLSNAIKKVTTWATNMGNKAKETGTKFLNNIVNFFKQLPGKVSTWLSNVISKVTSWASNMASKAKSAASNFINNVVSYVKQLPSKIWTWLSQAVSKVGTWGSNMLSKAKSGMQRVVTGVVNTIKSLPSKMLSIGKDLVKGLWNGISNMTDWVIGKIKGFGNSVLSGIKNFFGIKSPSTVFRDEVGKMLPAGMAEGITRNTRAAIKAMTASARKVLSAANAELSGANISMPVTAGGVTGTGTRGPGGTTYVFNQYNNSPKALSRAEIYRQTKNQLRFATQT